MKKISAVILLILIMLTASGCSMLDGNIDTLLTAPSPAGELHDIQLALEKSTGKKIALKYPSNGDYRSAIVLKDLNGDGIEEALAFYSTTVDNTKNMHINLIVKNGEGWVALPSVSLVATGVEKVEFADMNGDGIEEIIVGWTVYSGVEKSVGVYSINEAGLTSRILENYSTYICNDFNNDSKPDLLIINKDIKKSVASAMLLTLSENGAEEYGACMLDPAATEYRDPVIFKLENGDTAVYIDGVKGTGTITEMLIIGSEINNISYSGDNSTAFNTFRSGSTPISDINGDGNYDIPVSYLLTKSESDAGANIYKTNWYSYTGSEIVLTLSAIMNYSDGYLLAIPEKWDSTISVSGNSSERTRTVFKTDVETGNSADELLRIQAIPKSDTLSSTYVGSFKIGESEEYNYYAAIGSYSGPEAVTAEELGELFKIIG